jgi:hypothetical protein
MGPEGAARSLGAGRLLQRAARLFVSDGDWAHAQTRALVRRRRGPVAIFHTDSWDSPGGARFDGGLAVSAGTPIQWRCEYENDTGAELDFGPSASANEMCILAGLFYPSDGQTDFGCMK